MNILNPPCLLFFFIIGRVKMIIPFNNFSYCFETNLINVFSAVFTVMLTYHIFIKLILPGWTVSAGWK